MRNHQCKFSLEAVHPDQILKIISNLKSSQSCGIDNIDSKVIKLIKHQITPVLTHVVNLSIRNQHFPSLWKKAKVIPLLKKSETIYPKNYRPVSLLPIFSKILERAVFSQVVEYFETNGLLHPSHHGFRQKHNTCTALIQMIDTWAEAFEDDKLSAVLMLDMSAAFDLVNHDLLVKKLDVYGFDTEARSWITSYLNSRSQQVHIDGAASEFLDVSIGVPQGSILGPLLYVIFTNELPESVHDHLPQNKTLLNSMCKECGTICCYADDSTYTFSDKDPQVLTEVIANKYQNIATYMSQNKLVLNSNKTHLLIMASLQKHRRHGNFGVLLNTGAEILEPIDDEKLLGAKISNNFLWNLHIRDDETSMFRNLTSKINALHKISEFASFKTRKMVASGLIMSTIMYIIQVYGGCSGYLTAMLQVLQNKAARCVTRLPWLTPTTILLTQCGWLSIKQMVMYYSLVLLFKTKMERKPVYIYQHIGDIKGRNTRIETERMESNKLKDKRNFQKGTPKKTFIPRAIDDWNSLPANLRQLKDIMTFKKMLRLWIMEKVPVK